MKNLMLAAALTLVPVAGLAYEGGDTHPQLAQADGPRAHKGKRHKRGQRGKHKLRMMVKTLQEVGVSDAQLQKIKGELEGHKPALQKLREDAKAARKTGDPLLMQEAKLRLAEKRLEMTSDMRKHVTDEQWAAVIEKLKDKRRQRMERRMERMQRNMDDLD